MSQWQIYFIFILFWLKQEEMTEGRKASMASKSPPPPLPCLAQDLDLLL